MRTLSPMHKWIAIGIVLGTFVGCKHSEPLPSERLYMAAIAPASERSLGPMPDHVPEPDRGEENVPETVPTHGPEHGPEGRPENVPADQMPVEPGPEPGPEPGVAPGPEHREHREHRPHRPEGGPDDDGDGMAFKPEVAKRQAPTVLGHIGQEDRPTAERVLDRGRSYTPPERGFVVTVGEEKLAFRPPMDVIRWRGLLPMRDGAGRVNERCFVRKGRVTYACDAAEERKVLQDALTAQVLYWRDLSKVASLVVPTREKVVVHSKDQQYQVSLTMHKDTGRIESLSTVGGVSFSDLGESTFQAPVGDMLWESADLVANGAMERAEIDEFWALCGDYDGALSTVGKRVEVLTKRAVKRGATIDTRQGLVVEPDGEIGGRVCVALTQEVDGASRFRSQWVGQRWVRGADWTTILTEKDALADWLKKNNMTVTEPKRWRIRVFDTPAVLGPQDGVAVLELVLSAPKETP